jgi:3-hydroxyacyl-CoA dehydrogenase
VIAALHGSTLGGGAELALASHYRGATRDLSFGLPEVRLALMPGAGGTVRLPRLVGVGSALALMTSANPIDQTRAEELGLVDRALGDDVKADAIAWAQSLVAQGASPRRVRDMPVVGADAASAAISAARDKLSRNDRRIPAMTHVLDAVEACVALPFPEALQFARERFERCRVSSQSKALRHLFFAERTRLDETGARPVSTIGIVGAGTMGSGIALSCATAGFNVVLFDRASAALDAARARVATTLEASQKKGRLTAEQVANTLRRVRFESQMESMADAQLVIEAAFENLAVKQELFAALSRSCSANAILATNTSTLDVDAIAAATGGREPDVVGMHFFSPANIMKLVEIVRAQATSSSAMATVAAVTRRLGKLGIEVGNGFGFVGNRMLYAYGREKELMMLEGASPAQIDTALEQFGMAMGPNAVGDLAGLDIGWNARKAWAGKPDDPRFFCVADLLAERGRLGQKTGAGFYRYVAPDRRREPDPEVDALIAAEAAKLGVARREVSADEIVDRCILALVNEGAALLDAGVARSAADIDVIWCNGYGFPRDCGGPMHYAEARGLANVVARMGEIAECCGARYWAVAPALAQAAKRGAW